MAKKPPPKCNVCGKPCQPMHKNTDGTHTHDECLSKHSQR